MPTNQCIAERVGTQEPEPWGKSFNEDTLVECLSLTACALSGCGLSINSRLLQEASLASFAGRKRRSPDGNQRTEFVTERKIYKLSDDLAGETWT